MPYLIMAYTQGTGYLTPGGSAFYTANLTPGTSWAPEVMDATSSYTSVIDVNLGQTAFTYDPTPYGYTGWVSSYDSGNWAGSIASVVGSTVTPTNLGAVHYNNFKSAGKWYVEFNVHANSNATVGVLNDLAFDYVEPWANPSDVNNHIYLNTISGGVRRQGAAITYAAANSVSSTIFVQMFVDLDNGRILIIYPGTTVADYTNYLTY